MIYTTIWELKKASEWKLKLCWFPKKCYISKKQLWGQYAYYSKRLITGPGDAILVDYWIEKNEFLMWNLKERNE